MFAVTKSVPKIRSILILGMKQVIVNLNSRRVPIAAICHGGWMLCSGEGFRV